MDYYLVLLHFSLLLSDALLMANLYKLFCDKKNGKEGIKVNIFILP